MTLEQMKNLSEEEQKKLFLKLKGIRQKAKITNFSSTYKIGKEALARNSNMKLKDAAKLLKIYWERNKAILQIEEDTLTKTIGEKKWLYNPISKYWYSLRNDKDKFSTLNQGSAVYCFDIWVTYLRQLGIKIALQMHDEVLFNVKKGKEEETKQLIELAIHKVNERLKLNIEIGCSVSFNNNYADCH